MRGILITACLFFSAFSAIPSSNNPLEKRTQIIIENNNVQENMSQFIENKEEKLKDNIDDTTSKSIETEDNMGTIIIIEELYYINVFMGNDEEDICIRCSENDFRKIKEDINNGEITLVYEPIDQNKYLMMYENEQILLSYK